MRAVTWPKTPTARPIDGALLVCGPPAHGRPAPRVARPVHVLGRARRLGNRLRQWDKVRGLCDDGRGAAGVDRAPDGAEQGAARRRADAGWTWPRGGRPVTGEERRGAQFCPRPWRARGQLLGQAVDARRAHPPGRRHRREPRGARQRHAEEPAESCSGPTSLCTAYAGMRHIDLNATRPRTGMGGMRAMGRREGRRQKAPGLAPRRVRTRAVV